MIYCEVCKRDTFRADNGICLTCKNIDKLSTRYKGLSLKRWHRDYGMVANIDARYLIKKNDIYFTSAMSYKQIPNSDQYAPYFSLNGYYVSVYDDSLEVYLIEES